MNILVTGRAGCIGSDLAEALLSKGHRVEVFDNVSSGCIEHIRPLERYETLSFRRGELLDEESVDHAMENVDFVYHLAGFTTR